MKYKYILASASPRRKELLSLYIPDFEIIPADVAENIDPAKPLEGEILRLAELKCRAVAEKINSDRVVIAADTVVVLDGQAFGKPVDRQNALEMLKSLNNKTHEVITAVAVQAPEDFFSFYEKTRVTFRDSPDELLEYYVSTGEPDDKAGAYAVQGLGSALVLKIDGDYNNVVGLPLASLLHRLYNKDLFQFGG